LPRRVRKIIVVNKYKIRKKYFLNVTPSEERSSSKNGVDKNSSEFSGRFQFIEIIYNIC